MTAKRRPAPSAARFRSRTQFLDLMLDPFVDGRAGRLGRAGASALRRSKQASLPPDIALAYASILTKAPPQSFRPALDRLGLGLSAAATAPTAIRPSARPTSPRRPSASPAAWIITSRRTRWPALRSPAAAPIGGLPTRSAPGAATRCRPASMASAGSGRPMSPARCPSPITGSPPAARALGDQLTANFIGQSYGARLEGGYRVARAADIWGDALRRCCRPRFPHAGLQRDAMPTGGGFGLSYAAMNATDVRTELGARFDAPTLLYGKPLILCGRVAWAHDFVSNPSLSAAFQSLPGGSFTVNGAPIPHDSALTSAGARIVPHAALDAARQIRRRVRHRLADLRRLRHAALYVVNLLRKRFPAAQPAKTSDARAVENKPPAPGYRTCFRPEAPRRNAASILTAVFCTGCDSRRPSRETERALVTSLSLRRAIVSLHR